MPFHHTIFTPPVISPKINDTLVYVRHSPGSQNGIVFTPPCAYRLGIYPRCGWRLLIGSRTSHHQPPATPSADSTPLSQQHKEGYLIKRNLRRAATKTGRKLSATTPSASRRPTDTSNLSNITYKTSHISNKQRTSHKSHSTTSRHAMQPIEDRNYQPRPPVSLHYHEPCAATAISTESESNTAHTSTLRHQRYVSDGDHHRE